MRIPVKKADGPLHLAPRLHRTHTPALRRHTSTSWRTHWLGSIPVDFEITHLERQIVHACAAYGPRPLGKASPLGMGVLLSVERSKRQIK
jgi:hypothetical protein